MGIEAVLARIAEIESALAPRQPQPPAGSAFSSVLASQTAAPTALAATASPIAAAATAPAAYGASPGLRALQIAAGEIGVTEQPPGSNDGPRIAQYRQAVAGAGVGPWCAYFVSWAAREAGVPLGEAGQGFGAVAALWDWAQRTGRAIPASAGPPQPGDLIVWDGVHVGIVERVDAQGNIHTIEGNSSNMVTRRVHDSTGDGATGYVRLG